MKRKHVPDEFIEEVFRKRKASAQKMAHGTLSRESLNLEFLRHTPIVASYGPAGLNLAVKGVGFVLQDRFMRNALADLLQFIRHNSSRKEALDYLLERVYDEEKVDFQRFSTLELAKRHTFRNVAANNEVTLMFFVPPETSYEVRCTVQVHSDDVYHEYVNAVHDLFHRPKTERDWSLTPAYIFEVQEIYDNSPAKMGKRLY